MMTATKTIPVKALRPAYEPKREGDELLLTVPHYWGKGKNIAEAKMKLCEVGGAPDRRWRLHSVHPDTFVDDYGMINHPTNHPPIMIDEHDPK